MTIQERVERLLRPLEGRGQRLTAGWIGGGRLERTYLLVALLPPGGAPRVERVAGTLRANGVGQAMVWYGAGLLRVLSGPRRGLAVSESGLREDESFAPAGMGRELTAEPGRGFGAQRPREMELLANVEELLARPVVDAESLAEPEITKVARDPAAFVPRFNGETRRMVYSAPGYEDGEPVLDNFNRLIRTLAIQRADGCWAMSFRSAAVGGVTEIAVQLDRAWSLPSGGLDRKSDLFEIRVEKHIKKGVAYGGEDSSVEGGAVCAGSA